MPVGVLCPPTLTVVLKWMRAMCVCSQTLETGQGRRHTTEARIPDPGEHLLLYVCASGQESCSCIFGEEPHKIRIRKKLINEHERKYFSYCIRMTDLGSQASGLKPRVLIRQSVIVVAMKPTSLEDSARFLRCRTVDQIRPFYLPPYRICLYPLTMIQLI